MMRTIKFRAWEPDTRKMVEVFGISPLVKKVYLSHQQLFGRPGDDLLLSYMPDEEYSYVRLMQFTGLLDKNCKEIYEGDLVRHSLRETPLPVEFSEGSFVYSDVDVGLSITCNVWDEREVIGNIYENPELLANQSNKEGE